MAEIDIPTIVSAVSAAVSAVAAVAATVAAIVTARLTHTIKTINQGQLDHDHKVDRAYMSAGGVRHMERIRQGDKVLLAPTKQFEVHVNNHGSTTGEFTQIAIGF